MDTSNETSRSKTRHRLEGLLALVVNRRPSSKDTLTIQPFPEEPKWEEEEELHAQVTSSDTDKTSSSESSVSLPEPLRDSRSMISLSPPDTTDFFPDYSSGRSSSLQTLDLLNRQEDRMSLLNEKEEKEKIDND
jgi:hypothetical protein